MTIDIARSQAPLVSIIIPATSTVDLLLSCLRSIARFAPHHIPFETIVVLNNASDEKQRQVQDAASGIRLIASPDNLGMAGAGNRGRARAQGKYLILLHDDAEIEDGWMEALVDAAEANPDAGAVGGKVLDPDGTLQNAGMILWSDALTSPPWSGDPPPASAFAGMRAVDYCGTSSLLVRAEAWDLVGGLDEGFYPAYYVDVDLAMALREHGYVVLYQPLSRIRHHRGASMKMNYRLFLSRRNRVRFQKKWQRALEQYEPNEPGSPQAIQRAMARAQSIASSCRDARTGERTKPTRPTAFDEAMQERRILGLRLQTQQAYLDELADKLSRLREASTHPAHPSSGELQSDIAKLTETVDRRKMAILRPPRRVGLWRILPRFLR